MKRLFFIAISVCALCSWVVDAAQVVISGVPEYPNFYGCAPSCGAMILGYWDSHGYPHLYPGDPMPWRAELKQLVASSRHREDFWVGPFGSKEPDPWWFREPRVLPTARDCVADFMLTSVMLTFLPFPPPDGTYVGNADGWTSPDQVSNGLEYFARWRNGCYGFRADHHQTVSFEDLYKSEIDAGRPVILFVMLGSVVDHCTVGYGYDDSDPENLNYAAMDTFLGNEPGEVDWRPWSEVHGGIAVHPPIDGDVNGDRCVNVSDILFIRDALGAVGEGIPADMDQSGVVNMSDVLYVRSRLASGECGH